MVGSGSERGDGTGDGAADRSGNAARHGAACPGDLRLFGRQRLYAIRHASDDQAPSLFHRWSKNRNGRAVVSEPLETDEDDWTEVPPGSFCIFDCDSVTVQPFVPQMQAYAA